MAPPSLQDGRSGSRRGQVARLLLPDERPVTFMPGTCSLGPDQVPEESVPGPVGGRQAPVGLPLFPASDGGVCDKEAMAETFVQANLALGGTTASPDGSERISGHSLRVTGAQGLTRLGIDLWAVELIGRWGSAAVRGYVREVAIENSAAWASRAASKVGLSQMVAECDNGVEDDVDKKIHIAAEQLLQDKVSQEILPALRDAVAARQAIPHRSRPRQRTLTCQRDRSFATAPLE